MILINTSDVLDGKVTNHEYVPNENLRGKLKKSFQRNDILYSEYVQRTADLLMLISKAEDYIASNMATNGNSSQR